MSEKPDFLCVGMQKAATQFLFDTCSMSALFHMPVIKELHHFDRSPGQKKGFDSRRERKARNLTKRKNRVLANAKREKLAFRPVDKHDAAFADAYREYMNDGFSDDAYLKAFNQLPDDKIVGDVTPGYSTLDPDTIRHIKSILPDVRIVLLVRDPVSRAWSQYNMTLRMNVERKLRLDPNVGEGLEFIKSGVSDPKKLRRFLKRPLFTDRAFPSEIHGKWHSVFGDEQMKTIFFEDFVKSTEDTFVDFVQFLLLSGRFNHVDASADAIRASLAGQSENRKESRVKFDLPPDMKDELVSVFRDELLACRDVFGEKVDPWLDKYGVSG